MKKRWIILGICSALVGTAIFLYNKTLKELDQLGFSNLTE